MKKKILIGEDEKDISEMYRIAFENAGYQAITAFNGKEVIEKTKIEMPDIVLLDLNMPVEDGFQVLQEISEENKTYKIFQNIPVIVLSNYDNPQDIDYCMRMGAQDYIVKSEWTPKKIVGKVEEYIKAFEK